MQKKIAVRGARDRLRYSLLFELLLIAILAPLGAVVLERQVMDIGLLSIMLSVKAMLLNLAYNWAFDLWDAGSGRIPSERSLPRRILHAVGFECSLVLTSLPLVIWWLGLTILEALIMDIAVTSIVIAYTLLFGWCYDRLFPVPQPIRTGCP